MATETDISAAEWGLWLGKDFTSAYDFLFCLHLIAYHMIRISTQSNKVYASFGETVTRRRTFMVFTASNNTFIDNVMRLHNR